LIRRFWGWKVGHIWNGKNTVSGTKPTLSMYSLQLSTYVTCYLLAFCAFLKY
jgi:hypothetical protein